MTALLAHIETILAQHLPKDNARLAQAMRYSTLKAGKRLRAQIVYACAQDFSLERAQVDPAAAAIECLHAYSLIHDDLPAMDNDDWRRGKPSNHKAFDEATAILAGDALQTQAFAILAQSAPSTQNSPHIILKQIARLAQAAGAEGMVGGQMLDIQHTATNSIDLPTLSRIHQGKTAALITAALHLGALPAASYPEHQQTLEQIGTHLGLAYQIIDDILDATADSQTLGKTAGKDAAQQKQTYISHLGLQQSRAQAIHHSQQAAQAIAQLPNQGTHLTALLHTLTTRTH
ncbi:polyprenyl synthetase family protein [Rappaport israeli]|uniref:polyprenyl synthetase family protein n=1 Tax=Rappaport israeli TaxID=1839807 RepID=UPI0009311B2D|nr:farnesyl diphosphate synthase [Rappaport israeli]